MITLSMFILIFSSLLSLSISTSLVEDYISTIKQSNYTNEEQKLLRDTLEKLYSKELEIFERSQKGFKVTQKSILNIKNETLLLDNLPPHSSTFMRDQDAVVLKIRKSFKKRPKILSQLGSNNFLVEESGEFLLLNEEGLLFPLSVLNIWTKSASGCACVGFSKPIGCACCEDGGCVCPSNFNICVKCGQEHGLQCLERLSINNVTTFQHKNEVSGQKHTVIIGEKNSIHFFDFDQTRRTLREVKDWYQSLLINILNDIENIRYGEYWTYNIKGLSKRNFLFVFSKLGALNTWFEIVMDGSGEKFAVKNVFEWSRKGRNFNVVFVDGRIIFGYIFEATLYLEHMKINGNRISISKFHSFSEFKVISWQYLTFGRTNMFLLIGKHMVKIYLYDKGVIFTLQDIFVKDLEKVTHISSSDEKDLLIFVFGDRFEFYFQDESKKFLLVMTQKFEEKYLLATAAPILIKDIPHLLIETKFGSDLFELSVFVKEEEEEKVDNVLINKFRDLNSRYDYQLKLLDKIEDELRFARAANKVVEEKLTEEATEDSLTSLKKSLKDLNNDIEAIKGSLKKLKNALDDVVPKIGSKKTITGTKYFYGQKTSIDELVVTYAHTGTLLKDKEPLAKIIQNLVQIDDDRPIEGRKIFGGNVEVENLHTSTFNEKDMEDYITSNKPAEVDGVSYVKGISVQDDVVMYPNSEVFGRDLSEDVVSSRGYEQLGRCHFDDLKLLGGIKVETDIVNMESFKAFTRSFLKPEGNVSLFGSVTFSNLTINGNLDAASVMSVNKSVLLSELVTKSENKTLLDVKFAGSVLCTDLEVDRINGEVFPDEFVIKSGSWINFGTKSFKKINFKELSVGGYVNHVKTSDVVTKSTPQTVLGLKTFVKGIKVFGNLHIVSSLIDGVDINVLVSNVNQKVDKNIVIFEEEVTAPGVIVKGNVNNVSLDDVANDLVYKDDYQTIITGRKIFLQDLIIKKSTVSTAINKIDFSTFVSTGKKNKFNTKITFTDVVNFDNIKVNGLTDNTNLTELVEQSVLLDKPYQIITGDKHFETMLVNHMNIQNTLNHKTINKFLTKTSDQVFSEDFVFDEVTFDNLSTTEIHLYKNGTLNNVSINDIKKELNSLGNLDSELIVDGNVFLKKESSINKLNGYNVDGLYNLLLKNEKLQVINTDLMFKHLDVKGGVSTGDYATGNATLLKKNAGSALKIYENNYVDGNMWWESIEASELNVRGLVNGIKLHKLHEDLVYVNDPNTFSIKAPKHFLNGFNVFGDLETNSINGKDLRKDLFSKTTKQVVRFPATFGHIIARNISVKTFNNVYVNRLRNARKRDKSLIVAPSPFKGYVHISNLKLSGQIHDEDFLTTLNDALDLRRNKIIISGKKTFIQLPSFTNLNVVTLNSERLEKRKQDAEPSLNFLVVNGTVSALKLKADDLRTKNRSSLLSPSYLRNSYVLAKDISGSHKFENLVIKGNITAAKINGGVLDEIYLTRNTDQSVWVPMNVSSMYTQDVYVHGSINGYRISNDIFTKEKIKIIKGSIMLGETLNILGSLFVKGKFGNNNILIPDDLVFLKKKNKVNGLVSFVGPLVTTSIESTDQTLNGIELSVLDSHLRSYRNAFQQNILPQSNGSNTFVGAMQEIYKRECQTTSKIQSLLKNTLVEPFSFDLISEQVFDGQKYLPYDHQSRFEVMPILIYKSAFNHWMINSVHFGSCETKILKWDKTIRRFEEVTSLGNLGNVRQWIKLDGPNYDTVYFLAVASGKGNCGLKQSSLWKADHSLLKFVKIQEIESASRAFVLPGSTPYIYLDVGYKLTLWAFTEGVLEKLSLEDETQKSILKAVKSFDKPGGGRITALYYNNKFDILDDTRRRVLFMPNIEDFVITTHLDEVVFIVSKAQTGLRGKQFFIEAHLYKNLNLLPIFSETLNEPNVILPLDIPEDSTGSEMVFVLTANSPRVYRLGGEPFMETWAEFPTKLNENLWAFPFIDLENNFYLSFGDDRKIVTLRLEMEGKKFDGNVLKCN